jgi:large subunit ribosomal protein L35
MDMAELFAAQARVSRGAQVLRCLVCATLPSSMPKMKTHSGAKKRFRKTAKGKLRGRHAFSSHILEKKSPKRKRHFRDPVEISKADEERVNRLLGSAGR